jgi:hypothetical protein
MMSATAGAQPTGYGEPAPPPPPPPPAEAVAIDGSTATPVADAATAKPDADKPDAKAKAKKKPPPPLRFELANDVVVTPRVEYMMRYRHFEARDFTAGTGADFFRHRARIGLGAVWAKKVGVFAQVQDVRTFGEESNTLFDFDADNFDMHQGYLQLMPFEGFEVRAGRQEIAYENHRLIGSVGWIEQARSFDAVRFSFHKGMLKLDSFYAKVTEDFASPLDEDGNPTIVNDLDLLASNLHLKIADPLEIGLVAVGNYGGPTPAANNRLMTVGGLITGKTPYGLSYRAEGYGQFGEGAGATTFGAYLLAADLKMVFKKVTTKPFIEAFGEFLSGDDDPGDSDEHAFNTLYSTAHKFHGEMDFFLNLPVHTGKRGLMDIGGALGFSPVEKLTFSPVYHYFRAMAEQPAAVDPATGAVTTPAGLMEFGHELDLRLNYAPLKYFKFDVVYGLFAPGEIFEATKGDKLEHLVYSTAHVSF